MHSSIRQARPWLLAVALLLCVATAVFPAAGLQSSRLGDRAKKEYAARDFAKANDDARWAIYWSYLAVWPNYRGQGFYDGNMVLGRLALQDGKVGEAEAYLLASGKSHGSPVLSSFGPNMSLAKELLDRGDRQPVLTFLEECRSFWESHPDDLQCWSEQVRQGQTPDFGANLKY